MNTIKTSALTFIAIVACLMLLLTPDSFWDEAPISGILPDKQELPPINQQHTAYRFEHEQTTLVDLDKSLLVTRKKPELPAASSIEAQSINWPLILYPELARIEELGRQTTAIAFSEILPMLSNDDPVIRLAAIESLGDMTNQATLPALSTALNDPNPQLRIAALEALSTRQDESAVSSIEPYLYDSDREVRLAAIEALVNFESETSVYALAGLLSDPDTLIRLQAVYALGDIGGKSAISYLLQARYDPDETIRANAEAILLELES